MTETKNTKNTDKKTLYINGKKYKVIFRGEICKINLPTESTETK